MPSDSTSEIVVESKDDKKCRECLNINTDVKLMKPYTKQTGYYCSNCCQKDIEPSDKLFRRDMNQFWNKYPDTSAEDTTTF